MKSIEVVDDYTVKVNLTKWTNQVLAFIGRKSWAVFSPTAYEKNGADWMDTHPVGTGAFMLKSFTPDQVLVLEKNPNYWGKDAQGRQLPYLDGVEVQIFSDPTTMLIALQSGQLHGTDQVSPVGAQQLQADPNFTLGDFAGPIQMIEMNTTDPASVWSDVRMRQALEYALDKEGINASVGMGFTPRRLRDHPQCQQGSGPGDHASQVRPCESQGSHGRRGSSHGGMHAQLRHEQDATDPAGSGSGEPGRRWDHPQAERSEHAGVLCDQHEGAAGQRHDLPGSARRSPERSTRGLGDVRQGDHLLPGLLSPAEFYTLADKAQTYDNVADGLPDIAQMEKIAYDDAQVVPLNIPSSP